MQFFQFRGVHAKRDRANRAHIGSDVFAGRAVTSRHAAYEHSAFIHKRNTEPIELVFGNVVDAVAPGEFTDAAIEFFEIFGGIGVIETHHCR